MIDREGEKLWRQYFDGEVPSREDWNAQELSKHMELAIRYEAVYQDDDVGSILFFKEGKLLTKGIIAPLDSVACKI